MSGGAWWGACADCRNIDDFDTKAERDAWLARHSGHVARVQRDREKSRRRRL